MAIKKIIDIRKGAAPIPAFVVGFPTYGIVMAPFSAPWASAAYLARTPVV